MITKLNDYIKHINESYSKNDIEDIMEEEYIQNLNPSGYDIDSDTVGDGSKIAFIDVYTDEAKLMDYDGVAKWFEEYCNNKGWDFYDVSINDDYISFQVYLSQNFDYR